MVDDEKWLITEHNPATLSRNVKFEPIERLSRVVVQPNRKKQTVSNNLVVCVHFIAAFIVNFLL